MQLTLDETSLSSLDALGGIDALCAFVGQEDRPLKGLAGYADWRMCGYFSSILRRNVFSGSHLDCLLYPVSFGLKVKRTFLFGMGGLTTVTPETLRPLLQYAMDVLRKADCQSCAMEIPGITEATAAQLFPVFVDVCLKGFHGGEMILLANDVSVLSRALQKSGKALRDIDNLCIDDRTQAVNRLKKLSIKPHC